MSYKLAPNILRDLAIECVPTEKQLILSRDRRGHIAEDRAIAIYLVREYGRSKWQDRLSFTSVGGLFDRKRTGIFHNYRTVEDRYSVDKVFAKKLNNAIVRFQVLIDREIGKDKPRLDKIDSAIALLNQEGYYVSTH